MRKFVISASLYVGLDDYPLEKNIQYLHLLHQKGIRRVFISAHMPEANQSFTNELETIIKEANNLEIDIILDISKPTYEKLKINDNIYSLRLDWGFNFEDILQLARNPYLIELNASTITKTLLERLKAKGFDFNKLRVSHNFYPKRYTGLTQLDLLTKNKIFKEYNLHIMAYLPSYSGKRPPLYEGLPTIEEHRNLDLYGALADYALLNVDELCFGDAYCDEEELEITLNFDCDNLTIPIKIYEGISNIEMEILNKGHRNRTDQSKYMIRSSYRESRKIIPFNTIARRKFSVTIDNYQFSRYQGEVGIVREDLAPDERVNVVGTALISDFLLQHLPPSQKFNFIIRGVCK